MSLNSHLSIYRKVSTFLTKSLQRSMFDAAIGISFGTAFGVLYGVGEVIAHGGPMSMLWIGLYFALCGAAAGAIGGAFGTLCGYAAGDGPREDVRDSLQGTLPEDRQPARLAEASGPVSTNRMTPVFERTKRRSVRPSSLN